MLVNIAFTARPLLHDDFFEPINPASSVRNLIFPIPSNIVQLSLSLHQYYIVIRHSSIENFQYGIRKPFWCHTKSEHRDVYAKGQYPNLDRRAPQFLILIYNVYSMIDYISTNIMRHHLFLKSTVQNSLCFK